ncbi:hypothetical protein JOM56_014506 [Amanita muscaria]
MAKIRHEADSHVTYSYYGTILWQIHSIPGAKLPSSSFGFSGIETIFFSSSMTSSSAIVSNMLCFLASKGAIEQVARVLSKDLGNKGITVNTVSPGPLDTVQFREGKSQKWIDFFSKQSPSNRLGLLEDVAPLVTFLASPAAQWINGQNMRVNGGSGVIYFIHGL